MGIASLDPSCALQTIEIAQRESRTPTGETLLAGQSTSPKIELATTCTKAVKSGFISSDRVLLGPAPRSRGRSSPC
jgi:hypothetical protein